MRAGGHGERLPDFLIIGAQKCGTTTLYRDLHGHPDIFLPEFKEPNCLCRDDVLEDAGRRDYARYFTRAGTEQICGEASTAYTKWPDFTGAPKRARALLGERLKLIYVTRDPVARLKSQYSHEVNVRLIQTDINRAIREVPRLINYSRYAQQARQWLEFFPAENLLLVRLEDYSADPAAGFAELTRFLGVRPIGRPDRLAGRHNSADARVSASPFWRKILHQYPFYRRYIQPYIPWQLRSRIVRSVFPPASKPPLDLTEESRAYIRQELASDAAEFAQIWAAQLARNGRSFASADVHPVDTMNRG